MRTIKSVGVLSVAKIMGAIYAVMGLLFMPLFLLVGLAGSMAGGHSNPFGAIGGLFLGILAPVFYGGMGFVMGALSAFLYNVMAKWLGGIEVEVQEPQAIGVTSPR